MAFGLVGIGAGLRRGLLTSLRTIYVLSQKPWLPRPARSMLLSVVAVALILRCTRLATAKHAAIAAAIVATATASGIPFTATLATCFAVVCILVHIHPEDGLGHRVGAKGFDGERVENSLEALRHLAARDAAGDFAFSHFPFIEFDVQETKDGQLVLFHDAQLGRAIPDTGPNVTALQALRNQGIDVETVTVQELTAAQLATLHLGGNPGVYVPTLKQFLETCVECNVQRTLAVEIKLLKTDAAREQLLDLLTWYKETYCATLDSADNGTSQALNSRKYKPLGWVGLIAFPQLFALSFGEFGSPQWRRWAGELKRRGIPARACHLHWLNYLSGA